MRLTLRQASNALLHLERQIRATAGTFAHESDSAGGSGVNPYDEWASNQPGAGDITELDDDDDR